MLSPGTGFRCPAWVVALASTFALSACATAEVTREQSDSNGHGRGNGGSSGNADAGSTGGVVLHVDGSVGRPRPASDGAATPSNDTCAAATVQVEPAPLDIALLVDTSYSMDFDLRWQYVKGALLSFVSAPEQSSLGLSVQFFPEREQCDVDAYADPAIPMAAVADSRTDIEATLGARRMSGGTPLVQALQGVGRYAARWAADHPDHKTVIVVATDGVPDDTCAAASLNPPNDLANAERVATSLATGTPPLPVFVIGVGEELDALGAIAQAGGTDAAVLIRDGASAQKQFLDALRDIRKESLGCDYVVPKDRASIDYDTVNVDFTTRGRTESFYYVPSADDCDLRPDSTWYYDDPADPTKIVLCPGTCTAVAGAPAARIDIAYGCKRRMLR
jgi:Mg-chelatase subunit ChlD